MSIVEPFCPSTQGVSQLVGISTADPCSPEIHGRFRFAVQSNSHETKVYRRLRRVPQMNVLLTLNEGSAGSGLPRFWRQRSELAECTRQYPNIYKLVANLQFG